MSISSSLPLDGTLSPQLTDQLALQLTAALAAETHNEQVNSAKLRSVGQQHDYDQFKGMVAGAHLHGINLTQQPLDTIAAGRGRTVEREAGSGHGLAKGLDWDMGRLSVREQQDNIARQQELLAETQRNASAHKQPSTGQPHPTLSPVQPLLCDNRSQSLLRLCVCVAHDFKRDWRRLGSVDKPTEARHESATQHTATPTATRPDAPTAK